MRFRCANSISKRSSAVPVARGRGLRSNSLFSKGYEELLPPPAHCRNNGGGNAEENMHGIIYLVGLIVVGLAILSFFGLR